MCLSVFLLAERPIPVPPDEAAYPGLELHPIEAESQPQTFSGIQRVAPTQFVYGVSPGGYCGCYFRYETPQEFQHHMAERAANPDVQYANTPQQAETMWRSWRSQVDAVNSFGRYLATHIDAGLTVYVAWKHCAGLKDPIRKTLPPSYFGEPGFEQLPEDVLLTFVLELSVGGIPPWNSADRRTHEWLGCDRNRDSNDASDPVIDETPEGEK